MGCFRRLTYLVLIVAVAGIAWIYRDSWLPLLHRGLDRRSPPPGATDRARIAWEPITPEGAARAREAVEKLGQRSGPVFANVRPGDLTAYIFAELSKELPASIEQVEAAVFDRRLWVRATVRPSDFGGVAALGPLAQVLSDREPVQFGGTLNIVKPGLATYQVEALRVRELSIPKPMIPKLLRTADAGARPEGLADNALPIEIPTYIADVRTRNGKVTLYKAIP